MERFVFEEALGILHDLRQKAPGRGIWVHPRRDCLDKAAAGGFSRALKRRVGIDAAEEWLSALAKGIERRLQESLANGHRQNFLEIGQMKVQEAMKADAVKLLLVAKDASEGTVLKFSSNADRKGVETLRSFSGAELGRLAGREFVSVVGVTNSALGESLMRDEKRIRSVEGDDG